MSPEALWSVVSPSILQFHSWHTCSIHSEGLPKQFADYLNIVKKLEFETAPNYAALKALFSDLFAANKFAMDYDYDWMAVKQKARAEKPVGR